MIRNAKFVHANIVSRDWNRLARFYERVFGCERAPPERDFKGAGIDAVTGVDGAHIRGVHLTMPGWGESGMTLEIFQYDDAIDTGLPAINQLGLAHIAFEVESVEAARDEVLANGGAALGDLVTLTIANGAKVTLVYMRDPEGNIIELQCWDRPAG